MMWRLLLLAIVTTLIGDGPALAGTLVTFPDLPGREPVGLTGYLARPDSGLAMLMRAAGDDMVEPWPAVILLHGCGGTSSHSAALADRLGSLGYVALAVDSLGPRGRTSGCGSGLFLDQALDAYAALLYLATLDYVDVGRVALIGQSMGGSAVLAAIDHDLAARFDGHRFRAAIAFYPECSVIPAAMMTAPLMILIGGADQWNPAEDCERLRTRARPGSAPIALTVYPGVHHGFEVPQLKPGRSSQGRWLEYDAAAARDAETKVREFLAEHLANMSDTPRP